MTHDGTALPAVMKRRPSAAATDYGNGITSGPGRVHVFEAGQVERPYTLRDAALLVAAVLLIGLAALTSLWP